MEDRYHYANALNVYVSLVKNFIKCTYESYKVVGYMLLTQLGMQTGIKAYGYTGADEVFKEIK